MLSCWLTTWIELESRPRDRKLRSKTTLLRLRRIGPDPLGIPRVSARWEGASALRDYDQGILDAVAITAGVTNLPRTML
jgi:hypothetical protein